LGYAAKKTSEGTTAVDATRSRRFPVGAEVRPGGGVGFRVWAPACKRVEVMIDGDGDGGGGVSPLAAQAGGYFAGEVPGIGAGARYRFRLDGGDKAYPDPASRFQPEGPHGPSEVVDAASFAWTDGGWPGVGPRGQVIYELHVGTFTAEGSYAAAARELPALADLGITVVELLPLCEFPGRFGWGYDGVDLWAPYHGYGRPDQLRAFVDRAHALGLGVVLDLVCNHLGPDGNYLKAFAREYFTDAYKTDWGEAPRFEGPEARGTRELFVEGAAHWIAEYHFDGLRLDATQNIYDRSSEHVVSELARRARAAAGARAIYITGENESQHTRLVRELGVDALWNDDFHHTAVVALTGRAQAYYSDYRGRPQELISALRWGFLFQGQRYAWQKKRRGSPALDLPAWRFVNFLENHDQVANSVGGERLCASTSPGRYRAMTAALLLGPATPLLFQGQEHGTTTPFLYFADHHEELAPAVARGRRAFLRQFPSAADPEVQRRLAEEAAPDDERTFARCKLDHSEGARRPEAVALHRDLLQLRREDPAFARQRADLMHGAVLSAEALALRFLSAAAGDPDGPGEGDRLLLLNLGADLALEPAPEPLLAPPAGSRWQVVWSSEDPRYGGGGTPPVESEDGGWTIPGHAAFVLAPVPAAPAPAEAQAEAEP
jgi:maltooligosyltrehalose trehalohydrolase